MGHKDTAKVLLDHGAEVDSRAEDGRTPLMLAANKGDKDLVSLLLQAGADPTLADKSGATAASLAMAKGFKELAGRLQEAHPPPVAGGSSAKRLSEPKFCRDQRRRVGPATALRNLNEKELVSLIHENRGEQADGGTR